MADDFPTLIKSTAARVRERDVLWSVGIATGIAVTVYLAAPSSPLIILGAWLSFVLALTVRIRFSPDRLWAHSVQRAVDIELNAREAELANLRMTRGVAVALPEPLFILDAEGAVELANPAGESFVGSAEIEGRHVATVLRAPVVFDAIEKALSRGESSSVDFQTTGSVERSCRAFVAPLNLSAGTMRVLVFVRDMTSERRLEQMRADFVASASHELRTPLASLIGFIETLRGPARTDPDAQMRFLEIMHAQAERMQRLVADLMSLSRIELNEHVPPSDIVDIAEIAQDVIESLQPLFERADAIVDFINEAPSSTSIVGDRDEIFQAFQNLLDNGVKYGGSPAMIKVKVGRGPAPALPSDGGASQRAGDTAAQVAARLGVDIDDLVYVQFRDFGPGIERAHLPRLTERFYRVSVERSQKSGGTGLGLAIVKHISNRHKGGFQIESRLAGGSAFNCHFQAVAPGEITQA